MRPILIVEDERPIADLIELTLTSAGYPCEQANDGETAADWIAERDYELAILDIMLPKVDGYELLGYLRSVGTPVIFVTAKSTLQDRVRGLHEGADDYLTKPFSVEELLARLRVLLRKPQGEKTSVLQVGELELRQDTRQVFRQGQEVRLSSKEFSLLRYMMQNAGIVLSREKLEQHVWDYGYSGGSNVIDVYIRYLRKKLDQGHPVKYIHTVRGAGYVLKEGEG